MTITVKNNVMTFEITENEWDHFHDAMLLATGTSMNRDDLEGAFDCLTDDLKSEIVRFGLNDTVVRENIVKYFENYPI